jgi:hypothetical protein
LPGLFQVGWRGGISPPRSHGSGRDSLPSSGSYHLTTRLTERFYLSARLLPSLVDQIIRSDDPTPSLHLDYRDSIIAPSTLLRVGPSPCPASVLSFLWVHHLNFSLSIGTTGSHVPHQSPIQVHATLMPDATQAVSRLPLDFSWGSARPPVLTSPFSFRHLISGSLALVSLNLT